ncbi:MAG: DUF2251 domain-containing protein [Candidatus Sulfotelmatobacter sp.]
MGPERFQAGTPIVVHRDAPSGRFGAFFEDEGDVGYFYALDLTRSENRILDAVHIYNVKSVIDRDQPSSLSIVWSDDESKCALLINGYPHSVFDFAAKRGHCRTNFPNYPDSPDGGWLRSDHSWSDDAAAWLNPKQPS